MNDFENKKVMDLIEQFEKDLICGRGHIDSRFSKSKAAQEMIVRGPKTLTEIVDHLKRLRLSNDGETAYAWVRIFEYMQRLHGLSEMPMQENGLLAWIYWAEKQTWKEAV